MKKYKAYILPALIVLVLLFITPKLIDWLVSTSSPFGFIKPEDRNTWIGFYGAIIGGGMTLGGVWWTITYQDKKREEDSKKRNAERKEELALQFKPILVFKKHSVIELPSWSPDNLPITVSQFYLYFENVGRGEAININLAIDNECEITKGNFTTPGVVPISDIFTFVINIPLTDLGLERIKDFNITIWFEDARANVYSNKYHFGFSYYDEPCLRYFNMTP